MRLLTLPMALAALAARHSGGYHIYPTRSTFDDLPLWPVDPGYSTPWRGYATKKRRNPNAAKQAAAKRARKITRRIRP